MAFDLPAARALGGGSGAILPFGLHKGGGLAVICDLLAGALTGGRTHSPMCHSAECCHWRAAMESPAIQINRE
jgi:LDH2 family malate/lactate/ureidoglycolate dehydrogenase